MSQKKKKAIIDYICFNIKRLNTSFDYHAEIEQPITVKKEILFWSILNEKECIPW